MMQNRYSPPETLPPVGIRLLTIYAGFVFGLLPIFYQLRNSFPSGWAALENSPFLVAPLLIMLSAYLVWAGREDARFWFLVILTLYTYATGITNAAFVGSGSVPGSFQLPILGLVIHNFLIPPFYYVFLARQKAFFMKEA